MTFGKLEIGSRFFFPFSKKIYKKISSFECERNLTLYNVKQDDVIIRAEDDDIEDTEVIDKNSAWDLRLVQ